MENCNGTQLAISADTTAQATTTTPNPRALSRVRLRTSSERHCANSMFAVLSNHYSSSPLGFLVFFSGTINFIPLPSGTISISTPPVVARPSDNACGKPRQR